MLFIQINRALQNYSVNQSLIKSENIYHFCRLGWNHSRCPGTAQNNSVSAVTKAATSVVTQIARPRSSFLTYGSRMRSVRKGVVSDWPRKTSMGSSSYWCEMRKRTAIVNGINRKNRFDLGCTFKNINEKPTASPIQSTISPTTSLTKAETGVRLPNALLLRNLGKASCSIALKQYSF